MAAVAMSRARSSSADTSDDNMAKPKVLYSSPALSYISTVALSEFEVLEFSDDEDGDADEPSDAFLWCLVGSRIAPLFANELDGSMLDDALINEPRSETANPQPFNHYQKHMEWRHVGLRLAAVMKEIAEQEDADGVKEELDFSCPSEPQRTGADTNESSWRLVGVRLARVFSSLDCDEEATLTTTGANALETCAGAAVSSAVTGEHSRECSLEAHERWRTVGARLSAVLQAAEQ